MKTVDEAKRKLLIKQAHQHLNIVEREMKHIFRSIREKQLTRQAA